MHNGVYRTLEDVVDFYDRGGGAGIGIELPNQTLSPEPLRLSAREKRDTRHRTETCPCHLNPSTALRTLSHAPRTCSRSVPRCPTTSRIA